MPDTAYCSSDDLKTRSQIDLDDSVDDDVLADIVESTSRWVDVYCDRHFYQVTEARYFSPPRCGTLALGSFNDLVELDTLKTDPDADGSFGTTWTADEYELVPLNTTGPEARPYTDIRAITGTWPTVYWTASNLVEVTGTWGWPAVPANVREATLLQAQRTLKQRYLPADPGYLPFKVVTNLLDPYRLSRVLIA